MSRVNSQVNSDGDKEFHMSNNFDNFSCEGVRGFKVSDENNESQGQRPQISEESKRAQLEPVRRKTLGYRGIIPLDSDRRDAFNRGEAVADAGQPRPGGGSGYGDDSQESISQQLIFMLQTLCYEGEGLALFSLAGSSESSDTSNMRIDLKWCSTAFASLFELNPGGQDDNCAQKLNRKLFTLVKLPNAGEDRQDLSILELVKQSILKTSYTESSSSQTQSCNIYSKKKTEEDVESQSELFSFAQIAIKHLAFGNSCFVLARISNLTSSLTSSLEKLRSHYSSMLTNALSHERIEPLTRIIGLSSELKTSQSFTQVERYNADKIYQQSKKMLLLTESQIKHFQIECKKFSPDNRPIQCSLKTFIEEQFENFGTDIQQKQLSVKINADELAPECTSDWSIVSSCLYHLI
jgi:hypothetical protein